MVGLRVVVVGVPGVGKTTVVEGLVSEYRGAKLVNFGTVMLKTGLSLKWIKNRDDIRKLTVEKQRSLQKVAASKISKMKDRTVVVDTHLFIRTKEGFWPGLPFDVVRALRPTHLVLVQASPEEVARRRTADSKRYRDTVTMDDLEEELGLARSFLAVSSTLTGAPMLMVNNSEGRAAEVASEIASMLRGAVA
ncbi:MAG TPA: adenylate kinase [Nitrososphaerales archaeon]|nr:adenylate kinase [Nitrososphaerales archaeon]